ncbi:MAG: adenylosuccinase ade13 [Chrysothrix sp. TS-e1954]|nr:MAG: adenylosuccinase ade13 [Chrysothrix sp. TS-e1954]
MPISNDSYQTPLSSRYVSKEMDSLFSPRTRFSTWRQLWIILAEAELELGLNISEQGIAQMKAHGEIQDEEFPIAQAEEKRRRHDVMAHVHTFGVAAPLAAGQIHLGATSCYVTDNADLIFLRDGLKILLPKLAKVIQQFSAFALKYKDEPCLGYTHLQPAQLTTVGKRATLWTDGLLADLDDLERLLTVILNDFRGVKGTTGTQASFLQLFSGDHGKVEQLDELVTQKAGFEAASFVTGQTYDRKIDARILNALASFGATCQRIGGDIRHLAALKEIEEPFEADQIGSSAMSYKRNPMRSERLCSLGRNLQNEAPKALQTYAAQLFERTLDDSAIRRLCIPESFLCADACLILLQNISNGLVVYPAMINVNIDRELAFMATENVIMALSAKGVSRQEAHEETRKLSQEASYAVKMEGKSNDFIERMRRTPFFEPILADLAAIMDRKTFIGRAPQQVERFVNVKVKRALAKYDGRLTVSGDSALRV